jgi:hypothetical protein
MPSRFVEAFEISSVRCLRLRSSYFTPERASSAKSFMSSFFHSTNHGFTLAMGSRVSCLPAIIVVTRELYDRMELFHRAIYPHFAEPLSLISGHRFCDEIVADVDESGRCSTLESSRGEGKFQNAHIAGLLYRRS